MTREETLRVLYIIKSTYPQHYKNFTDHESRAMLDAWTAVLADYDYKTVCTGLKSYMANEVNGFPPSPGQVIDHITKLKTNPEDRISEGEAWRLCYKAICNSIYCAAEEFNKLPDIVQSAVGSPEVLRQWAQIDMDSVEVIHSNFLRAFRIAQERKTEELKMPESVRQFLLGFADRLAIDKKDESEGTDESERSGNADTEDQTDTDGTAGTNAE